MLCVAWEIFLIFRNLAKTGLNLKQYISYIIDLDCNLKIT